MAGIYIHIPFCNSKCSYCDFYSVTDLSLKDRYVDALMREIDSRKDYLGDQQIETLYFGGGTPSLLSPHQIGVLIKKCANIWGEEFVPTEITMEANPDDLSSQYLESLVQTPVNRLSIGIQSFVDDHLKMMNRRHDAATALKAIDDVRKAGFRNVTIDLIYGIPSMTIEQWEYNIEQAIATGAEHISAYHLTIEERTDFGNLLKAGKLSLIDEELSERQYMFMHDRLMRAGYEHYEISNFAKPGFRARHNSGYWQGKHYLGLGLSAHSYNGLSRSWCVGQGIASYLAEPEYQSEELSVKDRYNELLMVSLRCADGVDLAVIREVFGEDYERMFLHSIARLVNNGSIVRSGSRYYIPADKFMISDSLICSIFV